MRRGLTLIELLVAMALTLLLIVGIAQFFVFIGDTIRDGRAIVEMGGDIRNAVQQLRDDLNSVTAPATPSLDPGRGLGFIEYVEGYAWDMDVDADTAIDTNSTMQGDIDDILSFTVRSGGIPFRGNWVDPADGQTKPVESHYAEVVWFTTFKDLDGDKTWDAFDEQRFLVRRHLLIMPELALTGGADFHQHNDISARYDTANSRWLPNSLSTLTNRENRFIHTDLEDITANGLRAPSFMPNRVRLEVGNLDSLKLYTLQGAKEGEDLMLPNLLAFDVRAYDTLTPMYADGDGEAALQPGDPGYAAAVALGQSAGWGAYVDLNYNRTFGGNAAVGFAPPSSDALASYSTWDTWTTQYELDGLDQFGDTRTDTSTDGLDNDNANGVDDAAEFETRPPYAAGIRGLQVRIRMYEPGTRQTRQATVVGDFVSE